LALHNFGITANLIFKSNIFLIICCAFYLAWWLLAFKPTGAIKGIQAAPDGTAFFSKRFADMGRYCFISYFAANHASAFQKAGNNRTFSHCWMGRTGAVKNQRPLCNSDILS